MADTPRSQAVLIASCPDNTSGLFTNQNERDFMVSVVPTSFAMTSGASVTMTTTILRVNKTVGSATAVTWAPTVTDTQTYIIKDVKGDAATNPITITPSSGLIDGAASVQINVNGGSLSLVWDGTNGMIV